jgi:hypothetical protein
MNQQAHAMRYGSLHDPNGASPPPAVWRRFLWLALLVGASMAFSLGLACATPFAAFGAAAALTLSRRDALVLILSVWLANQVIGFTALGYPWTADTFAWGIALGAAVVFATLAGERTARRLAVASRAVSCGATFLVTLVIYEAALYAVAAALLGGTEDFAGTILGRIAAINAATFVGLLVLSRFAIFAGLVANRMIPLSVTAVRA